MNPTPNPSATSNQVGLVMLILTIKYRRAGPPLRLHAAIFGETTQL